MVGWWVICRVARPARLVIESGGIPHQYPRVVHKGADEFVEGATFVLGVVDVVAFGGC